MRKDDCTLGLNRIEGERLGKLDYSGAARGIVIGAVKDKPVFGHPEVVKMSANEDDLLFQNRIDSLDFPQKVSGDVRPYLCLGVDRHGDPVKLSRPRLQCGVDVFLECFPVDPFTGQ